MKWNSIYGCPPSNSAPWVINGNCRIHLRRRTNVHCIVALLAHESGAGRCSKGRARDGSLQESRVGTLELLYKLWPAVSHGFWSFKMFFHLSKLATIFKHEARGTERVIITKAAIIALKISNNWKFIWETVLNVAWELGIQAWGLKWNYVNVTTLWQLKRHLILF